MESSVNAAHRSQDNAHAAACSYLLVMLLQRLESGHNGLIGELIAGVEADRRALSADSPSVGYVENVFDETLRILRQADLVGRP